MTQIQNTTLQRCRLISNITKNKGTNALYLSASVFDPIINLKGYQEREVLGKSILKHLRLTFKVFHILVTVIYIINSF